MPSQKITDAWIRNLTWASASNRYLKQKRDEPPAKEIKQLTFIDTLDRGVALVCVLSSGGTKAWRVLTYEGGKPVSRKLGTFPAMSVKEARDKAWDYFENPDKYKAQALAGSFKDVAENWFKRHVEHNKLRSRHELRRHLDRYILPRWKNLPFHEIGRGKVTELLDAITDNHGPSAADGILATIRGIMAWQEARSDDYRSPIARKMKRNKSIPRDRVLNPHELRAVWNAASERDTFGAFIKMLLLTAQRREKVAKMKHADISEDGVWSIPSEDEREKGTAGFIKLPKQAIAIIEGLDKVANNPFVFAGRGGKAMNSFSQGKEELDESLILQDLKSKTLDELVSFAEELGIQNARIVSEQELMLAVLKQLAATERKQPIPRWTLHDLRRTARTLMSDAGVRPDIAERVLGHAIPGVGGVYDRSEYFEQKSEALEMLARRIESIVQPTTDNVVPLRGLSA